MVSSHNDQARTSELESAIKLQSTGPKLLSADAYELGARCEADRGLASLVNARRLATETWISGIAPDAL